MKSSLHSQISSQLSWITISRTRPDSRQLIVLNWTVFVTTLKGLRRKQPLYCWEGVFTDTLPSNWRPIVARFRFCGCLPSRCPVMGLHITIFNEEHSLHCVCSLYPFVRRDNHPSYPHKATEKIVLLYIFISKFLLSRRDGILSWTVTSIRRVWNTPRALLL
jgi:hypothetical protein